jgi:DNA polymerase III subunit beta
MKLICTQENFKKAILSTERVVGKQITLPILENILLEAGQGVLKVSATNLEIGTVIKIGAKIEKEGKITIPAKLIGSFASNLPLSDTVLLEAKNATLKIESGSYQASIKGIEAQDFPIIPEPESETIFSVSGGIFKNMVSRLLACVAVDNTRPELTGINVLFFESEIHLAATDSFRLAEAKIPIKKEKNYDIFCSKVASVIIPGQTLSEVLRLVEEENQEIKISIEEGQIFFQLGTTRIISRLINGKYPEYKHIIPQKFATQVLISKEESARAVKIASVFTNSKAGEVSFTIQDKKVIIESHSAEAGENKTELAAQVSGPEQKIIFNPRYVLDGINSVDTNSLDFFINSGSSPAVIRMVDPKTIKPLDNFTYVVMPIKN